MSLIYIQVNEINYLVSHKSKCNKIKHFIIISGVCIQNKNLYAHITVVKRLSKMMIKCLHLCFFNVLLCLQM